MHYDSMIHRFKCPVCGSNEVCGEGKTYWRFRQGWYENEDTDLVVLYWLQCQDCENQAHEEWDDDLEEWLDNV